MLYSSRRVSAAAMTEEVSTLGVTGTSALCITGRTIGFEAGAAGKRFEMESLAAVCIKAFETKGIGRQAVGQVGGVRACFFYHFLCVHSIFYYLCRQQPSLLNHTVILFVRP